MDGGRMTESEWLVCTDPAPMLEYLRGKVSSRKLRLFAVACCRRIGRLLAHEESRQAVEVAERFADGLANNRERQTSSRLVPKIYSYGDEDVADPRNVDAFATEAVANALFGDNDCPSIPTYATTCAIAAARACANTRAYARGSSIAGGREVAEKVADEVFQEESKQQALLARDIFGNPFRPPVFQATWLTPTVTSLAAAMYDPKAFDRLPALAEALKQAGCHDSDIMAHCRGPGEHVRGCWVVDLILEHQ
jgi:hypothetical protein